MCCGPMNGPQHTGCAAAGRTCRVQRREEAGYNFSKVGFMPRKFIGIGVLCVCLLGLLAGYIAYRSKKMPVRPGPLSSRPAPKKTEAKTVLPPVVKTGPEVRQISDTQMQRYVDTTLQSLRKAGKRGANERASVSASIAPLRKLNKAQNKMLASMVVPLLTPPQGGTVEDKIAALDYLYMTNSAVGEPFLPKLLKDPDADVRRRAELYQMRRAQKQVKGARTKNAANTGVTASKVRFPDYLTKV